MTTYRNVNPRPLPARGAPGHSQWRRRRPHPWGASCSCIERADAGPPYDAGETFHDEYEYEYELPADPVVTVASTAVVSDNAIAVLKGLLREAGVAGATI